eukprot:TRINITY_DN1183_c0_g1_i2.p1 TRINITY_DN1183_c0_g1~~TRINITY_DN1183_c0_g1_i2.p1  ORF type:complete len:337 (+),score=75.17 TRINITY_DN1183_c0_g1_i2:78-1088(+)
MEQSSNSVDAELIFNHLDNGKKGYLDKDDLSRALQNLSLPTTHSYLYNLAKSITTNYKTEDTNFHSNSNSSGKSDSTTDDTDDKTYLEELKISRSNFITYMKSKEKTLKDTYDKLDINHDGVIDIQEMKHGLKTIRPDINLNDKDVEFLFGATSSLAIGKQKEKSENNYINYQQWLYATSLLVPSSSTTQGSHTDGEEELEKLNQHYKIIEDWISWVSNAPPDELDIPPTITKTTTIDTSSSTTETPQPTHTTPTPSTTIHEKAEKDKHKITIAWLAKYLVAGGIAGFVSRTTTAPLDRIKVCNCCDDNYAKNNENFRCITQSVLVNITSTTLVYE